MKKNGFFSIIFREFKYTRKIKGIWFYLLLILKMIAAGLIPFVGILLSRIIIDYLSINAQENEIVKTIIILCSCGLVFEVIKVFIDNTFEIWFLDVRMREFEKTNELFLNIEYKYLEDANFRNELQVATDAISGDGIGFQHILIIISNVTPLIFSLILYCIFVGLFNWIILLTCLVSAIFVIFVNKKIADYIASKKEEKAKLNRQEEYYVSTAYDFSYGKDIRVYSLQNKLIKGHQQKANGVISIIKNIENRRFSWGLLEILFLLIEDAVSYYFVIDAYLKGNITLGQVSMYIGLIIAFSETIRQITDQITNLVKDVKYVESYFDFMDKEEYYTKREGRKALDKEEQIEIEFKNVSFKYPYTNKWILKNFNFKIEKSEKLAIVGLNGAGKSTIVKLITGLFYPNEGQILINGIDITEFDNYELQKMFSTVYQEINIFAASIIENIVGLDKTSAARERAIDALNRVGLEEKIKSLPNGYDTNLLKIIEDDGVELSGGQNQKIAIARALYKNGNMIILDEPTSALDALAEASIYQSFNDLVKEKTAIYISHRLSSTKFCDKIALFTLDGLKEYGTHDELMALKGEYYHMFETQGKYYREGGTIDEQ